MDNLKVEKKDGEVEYWNYDKVLLSIGKAMMPIKKAEHLAKSIEDWAKEEAKKGVISSTKVRDKIIELLKDNDPVAAESYRVYKKG